MKYKLTLWALCAVSAFLSIRLIALEERVSALYKTVQQLQNPTVANIQDRNWNTCISCHERSRSK